MVPSRTRLEIRFQFDLKFDPGASTLGVPPLPWEAQCPTGIEIPSRSPTPVVDLCCRALHCRHVCTDMNDP